MGGTGNELDQIQAVLNTLQKRVAELEAEGRDGTDRKAKKPGPAPESRPVPEPTSRSQQPESPSPEPAPEPPAAGPGPAEAGPDLDLLTSLRKGLAELAAAKQVKDIPHIFTGLASRYNLRLVVLKRWRSGLQAYHQEGITLPAEATQKRPDGRAPIPSEEDDIFAITGQERCLYAGPVPAKYFPLDLTLMLGRGSRDRQIVLLPQPVSDRWNTYLYLDADRATAASLAAAEILAQYALARMCLLTNKQPGSGEKVAAILAAEKARRREHAARRRQGPAPAPSAAEPVAAPEAAAPAEAVLPPAASPGGTEGPDQAGPAAVDDQPSSAETGRDAGVVPLTPEGILRQSGELPALPRAACHIMAVIEDPRTTATKLEKAIALDQALTAKVLRVANSPFYGAVRDIDTVSEAIVRLGFVTIRNWTLVMATKSVFLTPGAGMLFKKIWRQSVLSALACQLVSQVLGLGDPERGFLGGLMQNIGQLVLARAEPVLFHQILEEAAESGRPYHEVERELLGFDHGELGALLIKEWNLSRELEEAVHHHHNLQDVAPANHLPALIALGEEVAVCSGEGVQEAEESWQKSSAASFLSVGLDVYADLKARAQQLSADPQFFS